MCVSWRDDDASLCRNCAEPQELFRKIAWVGKFKSTGLCEIRTTTAAARTNLRQDRFGRYAKGVSKWGNQLWNLSMCFPASSRPMDCQSENRFVEPAVVRTPDDSRESRARPLSWTRDSRQRMAMSRGQDLGRSGTPTCRYAHRLGMAGGFVPDELGTGFPRRLLTQYPAIRYHKRRLGKAHTSGMHERGAEDGR
jgi:hypothetical protein